MPNNDKKGFTVKIDAELHAEVRQFLEQHEMTMAEFVTIALRDELHPKFNLTEEKNMGNMRTLAFQVPEELFHKIKDYLQRNNMTQKEFVIGLIESEIERDLTQRAAVAESAEISEEQPEESAEQHERADAGAFEPIPDEREEYAEEQEISDFSGGSEAENEEPEDIAESEEADESEDISEDEMSAEIGKVSENEELDEVEAEDVGMAMGM